MAAPDTADGHRSETRTTDLSTLVGAHTGPAGLRSGHLTHAQYIAACDVVAATVERLAATEAGA